MTKLQQLVFEYALAVTRINKSKVPKREAAAIANTVSTFDIVTEICRTSKDPHLRDNIAEWYHHEQVLIDTESAHQEVRLLCNLLECAAFAPSIEPLCLMTYPISTITDHFIYHVLHDMQKKDPSFGAGLHICEADRVYRLYRHSLKNTLSWCIDREIWYDEVSKSALGGGTPRDCGRQNEQPRQDNDV